MLPRKQGKAEQQRTGNKVDAGHGWKAHYPSILFSEGKIGKIVSKLLAKGQVYLCTLILEQYMFSASVTSFIQSAHPHHQQHRQNIWRPIGKDPFALSFQHPFFQRLIFFTKLAPKPRRLECPFYSPGPPQLIFLEKSLNYSPEL